MDQTVWPYAVHDEKFSSKLNFTIQVGQFLQDGFRMIHSPLTSSLCDSDHILILYHRKLSP